MASRFFCASSPRRHRCIRKGTELIAPSQALHRKGRETIRREETQSHRN